MSRRTIFFFGVVLLSGLLAGGCSNAEYMTENRLSRGLVVILPGIEGESGLNRDIRRGLANAGVDRAMPIWSWGRPLPIIGLLVNQIDFLGNRIAGSGIAARIRKYQDKYPGRPVHVIGHSGGGGVAVFVADDMGKDHKIDGLILLSASISSAYDLTKALGNCRNGILNIYSKDDVGLLGLATIVLGTVDGTHGPSAGLIGFDQPNAKAPEAKQIAYVRLYQVAIDPDMLFEASTTHASTTQIHFISLYVSPWILAETWPVDSLPTFASQ